MPKKAPEKIGSVLRVPLSQLHPHPQNPFAVRDDPAMQELKESVSRNGVLVPAIARPRAEGGYELIAGHRRKHACEQAGQDSMPVIVLNLNDDEAVIQLVDSNIQREDILPSERARAYKMKMDAIKRQGARTDLTSPNGSAKFRSDDLIGEKDGVSGDTVRNYISLNNLTPPLMQMVDEKKIALTPAYQLAALSEQEQELLVETMSSEQATPSLSQAQRMKKLSQSGELNEDDMLQEIGHVIGTIRLFFLKRKHFFTYLLAARCSEDILIGTQSSLIGQIILHNIYEEIGFNKNLIIDSVNTIVCIMVRNQILNSLRYFLRKAQFTKQFFRDGRPLYFLQLAIAVPILLLTDVDANIVG